MKRLKTWLFIQSLYIDWGAVSGWAIIGCILAFYFFHP